MPPNTATKLGQMGDVNANKEKLRKAIDFAKKNPDHPDSVELRKRLERGMFNVELKALGKQPFPVQQPKIDLKAAFANVQQEPGLQTKLPEPEKPGMMETAKEMAGDIKETAVGVGKQFVKGAVNTFDTLTDDELNPAQKFAAASGNIASGAAGIIGELTIGAGKAALTQEAENKIKEVVSSIGETVADTEIARKAADWYEGLDKNDKVIVDSLGGIAALVTEMVGLKGASVAGRAVKEGTEAAIDTAVPAIKQGLETAYDVTKAGARQVDELFTTSDAALQKRIQEQFQKAIKPTVRGKENLGQVDKYKNDILTATDVITKNKENLKFADDIGEVVTGRTPESLKEFSESITQTKEKVFKEYDALAKAAGEKGLQIDVAKLSNELDTVINDKALQLSNPEAVKYAQGVKERFSQAGPLTADEAQNVIKNYNNSLQAFYRNPTPEGLTRNAVDALMVNQVRKSLDEGIEGLTGKQYQALKNQYGALRTIEKDVLNATLRDARRNTAGLIDFTDIFTGGQLVTSLASGNVAGIAGAATQRGIKSYFKYLNDPNNVVKKMFQTADKLNARSQFPSKMGPFETSVTEPAIGMSIKSTVTPLKVGKEMTEKEFDLMADAIEDIGLARTNPDFNDMLKKHGLSNAQDEELVKFMKEATDQFERPETSFNQGATPQTTALLEEARKYKSADELVPGTKLLQNNGSEMEMVGKMNTPKGEMYAFRTKGQPEGSFELFTKDDISDLLGKQDNITTSNLEQTKTTESLKASEDASNAAKKQREEITQQKEASLVEFLDTLKTGDRLNATKSLRRLVSKDGKMIKEFEAIEEFIRDGYTEITELRQTRGAKKGQLVKSLVSQDGRVYPLDSKGASTYAEYILGL